MYCLFVNKYNRLEALEMNCVLKRDECIVCASAHSDIIEQIKHIKITTTLSNKDKSHLYNEILLYLKYSKQTYKYSTDSRILLLEIKGEGGRGLIKKIIIWNMMGDCIRTIVDFECYFFYLRQTYSNEFNDICSKSLLIKAIDFSSDSYWLSVKCVLYTLSAWNENSSLEIRSVEKINK